MNPAPAVVVPTGFHRLVAAMVAHTVADHTTFVVTSPVPGVGKTCSTRAAVAATQRPAWWLDASPAHTPTTINLELLAAGGYRPQMSHRGAFDTIIELADLTATVDPVIVVDDAHDLTTDTMAHLFMLQRRLHVAVGLIAKPGFGTSERYQRELLDRVDRWIEIDALPTAAMIDAVHQHHPLYHDADDPTLADIDGRHAKGRWRRWHQFTRTALRYSDPIHPRLDPDVIAHTLRALAWDRRPDPLTGPRSHRPALMFLTLINVPAGHAEAITSTHPNVITIHAPIGEIGPSSIGRNLFHHAGSGIVDRRAAGIIEATALLVTDHIIDVVVDDATRLPTRALDWLAHATIAAGTDLTLAHRRPFPRDTHAWLDRWPHQRRSLARHQARWRHPPPQPQPPPPSFPTVPDSDWPWFRTDIHTQLPPTDAAIADASYRTALHRARNRLGRYTNVSSDEIITVTRSLLTGIDDPNHALTTMRAIAAAAFQTGVAVAINPTRFSAVHTTTQLPHPARADRAIAIGAAAAGIPLEELAGYTLADAERLANQLPAAYRRHVQRQHLARQLHGARPGDPLITTPTGQPSSLAALTQTVRRNRPHTPTNPPQRPPGTPTSNTRWAAHVSLQARRFRPTR